MMNVDIFGRIKIGNNVFIGVNFIIMPGVYIGDNVCIAAGSVVTKNIPTGEVLGGIPARFIKTTIDYKEGILKKCDRINGLSAHQKEKILREIHRDWFAD